MSIRIRLFKFAVIGGIVAILGLMEMYILIEIFKVDSNISYILQSLISLQLNFVLNNRITWSDREGSYWKKLWKYYTSRIGMIIVNQLIFSGLNLFIPYSFAYGTTIVMVSIFNYTVNDKFVFRTKPST